MKEKLKAILGGCYFLAIMLWTLITGAWFLSVLVEIGFFIYNNLSHIISERNFTIQKFSSTFFKGVFSYENIANAVLWRLTLDVATMYRIANKFKLKWYDFLDGEKWIGHEFQKDSFLLRVLQHFFVGIPEAPHSKNDNN